MAQEYEIVKVSSRAPKEWEGSHGKVYYIKVMLKGHDKPVSVGKKSPDALKTGDTIFGTIVPTDYEEDKFKAETRPFGGGGSREPKDEKAIQAMWAIGQAISAIGLVGEKDTALYTGEVSDLAVQLFGMVDFVKGSVGVSPEGKDSVNNDVPESNPTLKDVFGDVEELDPGF